MEREIDISIVIPAFNEAGRLPSFLENAISYCIHSKRAYEIIVVDDGSTDNTYHVAESYKPKFRNLSVIRIKKNRGKGYAVKRGFFRSEGKVAIFIDADGSVKPDEIEKNIHYILKEGYDIFVGSRILKAEGQLLRVRWYRKFIGTIFNFFVRTILFKNIKDTQCGFKMFKSDVLRPLFSRSYLRGFGFDVEILYLAHKMGYKVKEGPVSWYHVSGSKINILRDSITMFLNILQTRNWHCTPINTSGKYMGPDEYRYMFAMEDYHWWFVSRRNFLIHLVKFLGITFPTILDVGAGTGGNLVVLEKFGKTLGIDVSRKAVQFCVKRGLDCVKWSAVEKMGFKDREFDIITCLDLLEHIPDTITALLEMKRVLKDDGKIIIMVPAFRFLWSQHDEALCHLRRYEKDSLSNDLAESGLKADKIGYFFFTSFFFVAPIRIMRRFFADNTKVHSDTTTLPPSVINAFLKILFNFEMKIQDNIKFPFGTSLYAIVSKKGLEM